ncbi:MAG: acyl carrier protein [Desulfuromonadales bacterium]|jgi:acyl carrier protein
MANQESIVKDLKKILIDDLFVDIPEEEIGLQDSLSSDLGVDSVGFVELITLLEDKYGIQISSDESVSENFRNLEALSGFVQAKVASL